MLRPSHARDGQRRLPRRFARVERQVLDLPDAWPLLAAGRRALVKQDPAALLAAVEALETLDMIERGW